MGVSSRPLVASPEGPAIKFGGLPEDDNSGDREGPPLLVMF